MNSDQEVGCDTFPAAALAPVTPPAHVGRERCVHVERTEVDTQSLHRATHDVRGGEEACGLGPYGTASDQPALNRAGAESCSGELPELWVGPEDIDEDVRVCAVIIVKALGPAVPS